MERRAFLATVGAATVVAGCSSGGSSGTTETPTKTDTSTPTTTETVSATESPTETPAPSPEIEAVNMISGWREAGDVVDNEVDAFGRGATVVAGATVELPVRDGAVDVSYRLSVYKDGEKVDEQIANPSRTSTDATGTITREFSLHSSNTAGWELGTYDAAFALGDDITGQIVGDDDLGFTLNEPLTDDEAQLVTTDVPSDITAGESFDYSLTLRNDADRDSSLVSNLSVREEGSDQWADTGADVHVSIGSDRERRITLRDTTIGRAGTYIVRLDSIGDTFTIEVHGG